MSHTPLESPYSQDSGMVWQSMGDTRKIGEIGIFLNPLTIFALSHAHFCSHSVCFLNVFWPEFFKALKDSHMIIGVLETVLRILIDIYKYEFYLRN